MYKVNYHYVIMEESVQSSDERYLDSLKSNQWLKSVRGNVEDSPSQLDVIKRIENLRG